ncbi:hypothetical protein VTJ83DRAFT_4212 [Remersonia thermophila]|uniref:Uncharacterized protein n=1 Tax=Remersonia thermophila TaxID=72144 RepID=A0ABR4D993_9PEZI
MPSLFRKHKAPKGSGKEPAVAAPTVKDAVVTPEAGPSNPLPSAPLLNNDNEQFVMRLLSDDDDYGPPPPLPPRPRTPELFWDTDSDSAQLPRAVTATQHHNKPGRIARLLRRKTAAATPRDAAQDEADREWADLHRALARLGIAPAVPADALDPTSDKPKPAGRAKAVALTASTELQSLLNQFVVVLRDIMRGAPTAANDLVALLDGRNDVLKRGFDKLPKPLQKMVTQLPDKLTSTLGPEILAAAAGAAEAQGLQRGADKKAGVKDAKGLAKFLAPRGLGDLMLTPAIVKSMLKAIVNALKLRWPAFVGTSLLWSLAIVLLLFVLWYCRKRGKEEREREEAAERAGQSASRRHSGSSSRRSSGSTSSRKSRSGRDSRDDAGRATRAEVVQPSESRRRRSRAS